MKHLNLDSTDIEMVIIHWKTCSRCHWKDFQKSSIKAALLKWSKRLLTITPSFDFQLKAILNALSKFNGSRNTAKKMKQILSWHMYCNSCTKKSLYNISKQNIRAMSRYYFWKVTCRQNVLFYIIAMKNSIAKKSSQGLDWK